MQLKHRPFSKMPLGEVSGWDTHRYQTKNEGKEREREKLIDDERKRMKEWPNDEKKTPSIWHLIANAEMGFAFSVGDRWKIYRNNVRKHFVHMRYTLCIWEQRVRKTKFGSFSLCAIWRWPCVSASEREKEKERLKLRLSVYQKSLTLYPNVTHKKFTGGQHNSRKKKEKKNLCAYNIRLRQYNIYLIYDCTLKRRRILNFCHDAHISIFIIHWIAVT